MWQPDQTTRNELICGRRFMSDHHNRTISVCRPTFITIQTTTPTAPHSIHPSPYCIVHPPPPHVEFHYHLTIISYYFKLQERGFFCKKMQIMTKAVPRSSFLRSSVYFTFASAKHFIMHKCFILFMIVQK